jgi:indole-3-glycerol phosphate synthase
MTIRRLLQSTPFEPEEIERLVAAYERTLRALGLKERDDPLTQAVAKKVIEIGQSGIRDPQQLSELALRAFRDL